jgi:hypothetical protein
LTNSNNENAIHTNPSDFETDNFVRVMPNPNNGTMTVLYNLNGKQNCEFVIYDLTGQKVFSQKLDATLNSVEVKSQEMSNGMYFYHLMTNGVSLVKEKLVIIR